MTGCIFCKIISGEIPCEKIMDDEYSISFMDVGPLAEGHTLLVPREHYETLDQVPADVAGRMLKNLPILVNAVQRSTDCEGVNVLQNNGTVAHQEVPHVHFHIIPRNTGDNWQFNWPASKYPAGRMEELAEKIRSEVAV